MRPGGFVVLSAGVVPIVAPGFLQHGCEGMHPVCRDVVLVHRFALPLVLDDVAVVVQVVVPLQGDLGERLLGHEQVRAEARACQADQRHQHRDGRVQHVVVRHLRDEHQRAGQCQEGEQGADHEGRQSLVSLGEVDLLDRLLLRLLPGRKGQGLRSGVDAVHVRRLLAIEDAGEHRRYLGLLGNDHGWCRDRGCGCSCGLLRRLEGGGHRVDQVVHLRAHAHVTHVARDERLDFVDCARLVLRVPVKRALGRLQPDRVAVEARRSGKSVVFRKENEGFRHAVLLSEVSDVVESVFPERLKQLKLS